MTKYDPADMDPLLVDRNKYRPLASPNRVESVWNSLAGLWVLIRSEQSVRILSFYTLLILGLCLWLQIDVLRFCVVLIPVGITWIAEVLNASIEATVDLAMPDLHPLAKIAKDLGSAGAFLSAALSTIVSILLLFQPLLEKLEG